MERGREENGEWGSDGAGSGRRMEGGRTEKGESGARSRREKICGLEGCV